MVLSQFSISNNCQINGRKENPEVNSNTNGNALSKNGGISSQREEGLTSECGTNCKLSFNSQREKVGFLPYSLQIPDGSKF